jgi:hypothetical protein
MAVKKTPKKRSRRSRSPKKRSARLRLISIKPSSSTTKKYVAEFESNGRRVKRQFGAKGYSDFTKNKDPERKKLYITRHKSRENWNDPMSAGALSRWILWNKPTVQASIQDYKRKFKL